jgi:subtilisin-like proprotein convertase family protein
MGLLAGHAAAQPTCGGATGPDVIVGDLTGPSNFSVVNGLDAISIGSTSCNVGTVNVQWNAAPANTHPVIGGTLYRYQVVNGAAHFDQIGQSWLKHAFEALTGNVCCTCNGQGGSVLGVGCSDPYTSDRNGTQSGLGPKYQVNAHTGMYPTGNAPHPSGGNAGRLEFLASDVAATAGGTGANLRFFGECQYVTQDDATAGNQNNNASYREMSTTGTTDFTFAFVGNTVRGSPAVRAWKTIDPTVTQTDTQVGGDGLYIVSSKATSLGGGQYHYEFNVFNLNGDRDGGSFSVPVPDAATVTNMGFNCPVYRYGDGDGGVSFSSTPWSVTRANNVLKWSTCTNNAIRWGNAFSFRFDANVAPASGSNVAVGLWKPPTAGSPSTSFLATAQSPGVLAGAASLTTVATANPPSAPITGTTLLTVAVTPASSPASTGITVTADLTAMNGSSSQMFYDDGTHGDVTPGDNVFSYLATLTEPMSAGTVSIPFTASDAQGRSSSCTLTLTSTAAPTGRCCAVNQSCSITTAYLCGQANGQYGGNGSACSNMIFQSANTFPIQIPDNTGASATSTIVVPAGAGAIANNVVVSVGLTHTWVGDLTGTLTHGAQVVTLFSHAGGVNNSNDLGGVYTFSQSAGTSFVTASASNPIPSGTYTPSGNLNTFTGQFDGTWTLTVNDNASLDTGTINSFTMNNPYPVNYQCPPLCGSADFNCDGAVGTDADIESFFACIAGTCPPPPCTSTADFNHDGSVGTDADIESFFRVLGGGQC